MALSAGGKMVKSCLNSAPLPFDCVYSNVTLSALPTLSRASHMCANTRHVPIQ
jgi:hypothetical protein